MEEDFKSTDEETLTSHHLYLNLFILEQRQYKDGERVLYNALPPATTWTHVLWENIVR